MMIKVNDVCLHSFSWDTWNKARCVVKVKSIFSEDIAEIDILRVIRDDSGNGAFTDLCNTKRTLLASVKSLKKLESAKYNFLIDGVM